MGRIHPYMYPGVTFGKVLFISDGCDFTHYIRPLTDHQLISPHIIEFICGTELSHSASVSGQESELCKASDA